jgi:hypothetical protein
MEMHELSAGVFAAPSAATEECMTSQEVASILRRRKLPDQMNPYGFPLNDKFRLERGSGIAGRGYVWNITHIQTGEKWRGCETPAELRKHLDHLFKELRLGIYRGRSYRRTPPPQEGKP